MKIEEHRKALEEHLENIKLLIEKGIEQNQRNIGFNVSQGAVELFSIFMHSLNLIEGSGDQFDHRIFKSKSLIKNKLPLSFPSRTQILNLMEQIENERIALCYGSRKPKQRIEKAILDFQELKKLIEREIENAKKK